MRPESLNHPIRQGDRLSGRRRPRRILLMAVIGVGLLLLATGLFLRGEDGTHAIAFIRRTLEGMGWGGVLIYLVFFVLGSFLMLPATALSIPAPALFGPWVGFAAILAGNMAAAASIFLVLRWAGSRWGIVRGFQGEFPSGLSRFAHGSGLLLVFYARLLMLPASFVIYASALLPISFWRYVVGTFLGVLPHVLSTALSVGLLRDALLAGQWRALLRWESGLLVITYLLTFIAVHGVQRRMRERGKGPPTAGSPSGDTANPSPSGGPPPRKASVPTLRVDRREEG